MTVKVMQVDVNDTPAKHPRTVEEAFGAASYGPAIERVSDRPFDRADVIVLVGCAVITMLFVALVVFGVVR